MRYIIAVIRGIIKGAILGLVIGPLIIYFVFFFLLKIGIPALSVGLEWFWANVIHTIAIPVIKVLIEIMKS